MIGNKRKAMELAMAHVANKKIKIQIDQEDIIEPEMIKMYRGGILQTAAEEHSGNDQ